MNSEEVFNEALFNVDLLVSSLKNPKRGNDTDLSQLDLKEFNSNMLLISKALSQECTKFSIAHSSPPFPEATITQSLAGLVCNTASQLVGSYLSLPSTVGATLLTVLCREIESLILNLKQFIECIRGIVLRREKAEISLISTGILWEFCDRISSLPKTNAEAITSILHKEEQLISDGLQELNEVNSTQPNLSDCSSEDDESSESEFCAAGIKILPSVKGLVKSACALLLRTQKIINRTPSCNYTKLDPLVEQVSKISNSVDDLICSLYVPINLAQVIDHSNVLASKLTTILETVKGIASEADHDGIQFIATAIQHNLQNLQTKASE